MLAVSATGGTVRDMEFREMYQGVMQTANSYGDRYGITIDQDFAVMKLYEEVGEFAQAVLIHRKQSRPEKHLSEEQSKKELARELADVVGLSLVIADRFDIDLEEAIVEKWINRRN